MTLRTPPTQPPDDSNGEGHHDGDPSHLPYGQIPTSPHQHRITTSGRAVEGVPTPPSGQAPASRRERRQAERDAAKASRLAKREPGRRAPIEPQRSKTPKRSLHDYWVFVRSPGAEHDDETADYVDYRLHEAWLAGGARTHVTMLDGAAYDALAFPWMDPFAELRASEFTCAAAPDELLMLTLSYYQEVVHLISDDLQVRRSIGLELVEIARAWNAGHVVPLDVEWTPLSMLAEHTLYTVARAAFAHSNEPAEVTAKIRSLIENGWVQEMLDPRDGSR